MNAINLQNRKNTKQLVIMLSMLLFLCTAANIYAENIINPENVNPTEQNTLSTSELEQSDVLEINSEILFSFSIPQGEYVRLSIFNTKGIEIKVLVDDNKKSGEFMVDLSQANLTNGTYYYRLVVGKYKEVKKMNYTI